MAGLGYACAVLLAAVFVRAGAAKLARPSSTAAGFRALGVPAAAAPVVPVVELAVAVGLLAVPRVGALLALALLAAFTVVVARAVAGGVAAPCNCFGTARAEPVSWIDVARNGMLAAAAAVALAASGPVLPRPAAVLVAAGGFAAGVGTIAALRTRTH